MNEITPIEELAQLPHQKMVVDAAVEAIRQVAPEFWATGRGAGKSTARAMIAHAILNDDKHPPRYKVVPNDA